MGHKPFRETNFLQHRIRYLLVIAYFLFLYFRLPFFLFDSSLLTLPEEEEALLLPPFRVFQNFMVPHPSLKRA